MPTVDPAAIAATLLQQAERAWNNGDGPAFGAVFADESDFVDIRGGHHRGDGALIGRGHQAIFDSIYADSTISYRLEVARLLAPGCVVAVAISTLDAPGGPLRGVNHSRMTVVIAEEDGRWCITAFQNTLVVEGRLSRADRATHTPGLGSTTRAPARGGSCRRVRRAVQARSDASGCWTFLTAAAVSSRRLGTDGRRRGVATDATAAAPSRDGGRLVPRCRTAVTTPARGALPPCPAGRRAR
jgi:uncharacterized protein (TIGR02246 family)